MDIKDPSEKDDPTDAELRRQAELRNRFKRDIEQAGGIDYPDMDFSTFVLSLGSSAAYHLGTALPDGDKGEVNLEVAQQTIDILSMLEHKTVGNLTPDETELLSNLLYDLRLRYVQTLRDHKP